MYVIATRAKTQGEFRQEDISALLRDISVEILKGHPVAQLLIQDLYRITQDKSILKHIKDPKFRGQALDESMGR